MEPPQLLRAAGIPIAMYPEVHAHRFCAQWEPGSEPEDGGGETIDNVVPLRGVV